MYVKKFEVTGLFGQPGKVGGDLNKDLNVLTGRNGAGKTSFLKLMWYIMSGNILIALQEVPFNKCELETDFYNCVLHRLGPPTCRVEFQSDEKTITFDDYEDEVNNVYFNAEDGANTELMEYGSSLFLPTFRRIEGGFTLTSKRRPIRQSSGIVPRQRSDIEEALIDLARKLSNKKHIFVSSISTTDVETLLLRRFGDYSQEYNDLQQSMSDEIIGTIKQYKVSKESNWTPQSSDVLLDEIRAKIEAMEGRRSEVMAPIDTVRATVEQLIKHTGIKIGTRLSFGDAARGVPWTTT